MTDTVGRVEQLTREVRRDLELRHGYFATLSPEFERRVGEEVKRRLSTPPFPDAWRCRACRWWERDSVSSEGSGGAGECARVKLSNASEDAGALATLVGEGDSLLTTADFGCIQWQHRED